MKIRIRIVCLLAILVALGTFLSCDSMLGDWLDTPSGERDVIWKNVGYEWGTATLSYGQASPVEPHLFSDGSSLYAGWINEDYAHIYRYNGNDSSPNWEYYTEFYYMGMTECTYSFFQGRLYLLFGNGYNIYITSFDAYNYMWDTEQSLSYAVDVTSTPADPRLVEHHDMLYAQWLEDNSVRVKRFDGAAWQGADMGVEGVVGDTYSCARPDLHSNGNYLYSMFWHDTGAVNYIMLYEYDELTGTDWYQTGYQLNFDGGGSAVTSEVATTSLDGKPFTIWKEPDGGGNRISASTRDMYGWYFIDGGYSGGLRFYAYSVGGASSPKLVPLNDKVCAFWLENDGGANTVRARVLDESGKAEKYWADGGDYYSRITIQDNDAIEYNVLAYNSKIYVILIENTSVDMDVQNHVHVMVGY